jgi:hypothetical protein
VDYFEAPQDYSKHDDQIAVFLAGGIGNCVDWQAEATDMLNGTELLVLNPRRVHFETPWTREASEEQIEWEFHALRRADIILFWFPGGKSVQPIAMFELGYWLGRYDRPLVVGRSPEYPRRDDIDIQTNLAHPKQAIFTSLAACMDMVEYEAEYHPRARKAWHR